MSSPIRKRSKILGVLWDRLCSQGDLLRHSLVRAWDDFWDAYRKVLHKIWALVCNKRLWTLLFWCLMVWGTVRYPVLRSRIQEWHAAVVSMAQWKHSVLKVDEQLVLCFDHPLVLSRGAAGEVHVTARNAGDEAIETLMVRLNSVAGYLRFADGNSVSFHGLEHEEAESKVMSYVVAKGVPMDGSEISTEVFVEYQFAGDQGRSPHVSIVEGPALSISAIREKYDFVREIWQRVPESLKGVTNVVALIATFVAGILGLQGKLGTVIRIIRKSNGSTEPDLGGEQ